MTAQTMTVGLVVNGDHHTVEVAVHHTLLDVLRNQLDMTGTKECCAEGECGACSIVMDGRLVNSCLVLGAEADGSHIHTIEGLSAGDALSALQEAFLTQGAVQCGFCIPGMVMAATYLLEHSPDPDPDDIREGLSGNLCRCAGYSRIAEAVREAAAKGLAP